MVSAISHPGSDLNPPFPTRDFRYTKLGSCIHSLPTSGRGTAWPAPGDAEERLFKPPFWLDSTGNGLFGDTP